MKKVKVFKVEAEIETNASGEAETTYQETGEFHWVDYVLPLDSGAIKDWGFDPNKTFETRTRADVSENTFVKIDKEVFHIQKVLNYPRFKQVFLERVDVDS